TLAARWREHRTAALYGLTRALAGARDLDAIAATTAAQMRAIFDSPSALLIGDASGLSAHGTSELELTESDRTVARWSLDHAQPAGKGLDTLPGARVLCLPVIAGTRAIAVLAALPIPDTRFQDPNQRHLLEACVGQIGLALE